MSALDSMVRLHRWMLDEKQRKLGELQAFLDRLTEDLSVLDGDIETEREATDRSGQTGSAFPAYLAAALDRRKKLCETIANVEKQVQAARAEVAEASGELGKYELARRDLETQESVRRGEHERANLDELGAGVGRRGRVARD
jgi:flagellar export protein FliJ